MPKQKFKEIVDDILKNNKEARTNGTILVIEVWRRYARIFVPYFIIPELPQPATILRERRDIMHKQNKYNEEYFSEEGITIIPKEELNMIEKNG